MPARTYLQRNHTWPHASRETLQYTSAMPLAAGTKLDSYEVLGLLGAGAMGEVYRARDPALKREVAIKILPSFVSRDPDRLRRFEQEAQAAAGLDHPNILAVHHFGVVDGAPYFVSELLVGESLRQALQRGPLPVRKAVDCGIQIAHGLAAAHEHGVIHRDLKPDNLFVTKDGRVKILDFGLAKLKRDLGQQESGSGMSTQTMWTDPGIVMGTVGYMSPEQVRGQAVDHRTDIFPVGAILYEMLTGSRAFQRSTSAETMTAILNEDPPPISRTGANIMAALQRVINRCLEKNPEQRFHSASDLAFALDALSDSGASPVATPALPGRSLRGMLVWSIALTALILLATFAYIEIRTRNAPAPLRISEYVQLTHNGHAGYALGTDGSRLYLRTPLAQGVAQVSVSGGEIERVPSIPLLDLSLVAVSPDGSTFLVQSFEKRVALSEPLFTVQIVGGSHRHLADGIDATWSPDGALVAYSAVNGDINIINSDGTNAHKLASVGAAATDMSWSPDGKTIRFNKDKSNSLWEITSLGSNLHPLLADWQPSERKCCGRWSPNGDFFAFLGPGPAGPDSQIYALDERRGLFRHTIKEPFQLTAGPINWDAPIFSRDGKKIFATGSTRRGELMRLDAKSNQFQPFLGGISADLVAFSKDGQSIAYVSYPDDILWRANRDGSNPVQLTSPPLQPKSAAWSPDGTEIISVAPSPQGYQSWIVPAEGGSPRRLVPEDRGQQTDPSWSPDGRTIIFATNSWGGSSSESHICVLDLASHQITKLPGSDGKFAAAWSPDGKLIKAQSLDLSTLYMFDVKTQHWSTLYKGISAYATWSRDSRYLHFLRYMDDPAILRIPITGGEDKLVVDLKGFPFTGTGSLWFGLDPTDAPLMLRDVSTTDVYALNLERK